MENKQLEPTKSVKHINNNEIVFYHKNDYSLWVIKHTHRENKPSNKNEELRKSLNIYIWAIGILNQLFIRDSYTQIKFSKK